ncbi:hypothetical protein LSTR_LSTR009710 [Laodelphax striatellus]|uniref:Uncharacterized protein n=1 Tax=Laodelphax striatellus TaxID=195883 RepID=A0A482WVH8_LAOST|nr:hypothetical protein LSTR_LSTR009710 [Laodelphax striatellus]
MASNLVIATCLAVALFHVAHSFPTSCGCGCGKTAIVIKEDKCCCPPPCCACHKKCGDTIVIREPDTCCCHPVCVPVCGGYGYGSGYGYGAYGAGYGYGGYGCGCCQPCCACHKKCGDTIIVKEPDTCCCRPVCRPVVSCCC